MPDRQSRQSHVILHDCVPAALIRKLAITGPICSILDPSACYPRADFHLFTLRFGDLDALGASIDTGIWGPGSSRELNSCWERGVDVGLSYGEPLMRGSAARCTSVVLELGVQAHDFIDLDLRARVPHGDVDINVPCPSACPRWGMIFPQRNFVHT